MNFTAYGNIFRRFPLAEVALVVALAKRPIPFAPPFNQDLHKGISLKPYSWLLNRRYNPLVETEAAAKADTRPIPFAPIPDLQIGAGANNCRAYKIYAPLLTWRYYPLVETTIAAARNIRTAPFAPIPDLQLNAGINLRIYNQLLAARYFPQVETSTVVQLAKRPPPASPQGDPLAGGVSLKPYWQVYSKTLSWSVSGQGSSPGSPDLETGLIQRQEVVRTVSYYPQVETAFAVSQNRRSIPEIAAPDLDVLQLERSFVPQQTRYYPQVETTTALWQLAKPVPFAPQGDPLVIGVNLDPYPGTVWTRYYPQVEAATALASLNKPIPFEVEFDPVQAGVVHQPWITGFRYYPVVETATAVAQNKRPIPQEPAVDLDSLLIQRQEVVRSVAYYPQIETQAAARQNLRTIPPEPAVEFDPLAAGVSLTKYWQLRSPTSLFWAAYPQSQVQPTVEFEPTQSGVVHQPWVLSARYHPQVEAATAAAQNKRPIPPESPADLDTLLLARSFTPPQWVGKYFTWTALPAQPVSEALGADLDTPLLRRSIRPPQSALAPYWPQVETFTAAKLNQREIPPDVFDPLSGLNLKGTWVPGWDRTAVTAWLLGRQGQNVPFSPEFDPLQTGLKLRPTAVPYFPTAEVSTAVALNKRPIPAEPPPDLDVLLLARSVKPQPPPYYPQIETSAAVALNEIGRAHV